MGFVLAALLWMALPAMAQNITLDEAVRIARREVRNQMGVSNSDVQVQEASESRHGFRVRWAVPGRHGRSLTGLCVVSRRGEVVEFKRDETPSGPRFNSRQAIDRVQETVRQQVLAEQGGGKLYFAGDASTFDMSHDGCGVQGTGSLTRRGAVAPFSYSGYYDARSGNVSRVNCSWQGGPPPPTNPPPPPSNPPPPQSGGPAPSYVSLRAPSGQFVGTDFMTGLVVCQSRRAERLALFDHNGGSLQDGDPVSFRAGRGGWFQAKGGGGQGLVVGGGSAGGWETFTIVKLDTSAGPMIQSGDRVALRCSNGQWVTAENGGGSKLNGKGASQGPWEVFIIEFR